MFGDGYSGVSKSLVIVYLYGSYTTAVAKEGSSITLPAYTTDTAYYSTDPYGTSTTTVVGAAFGP